MTSMAEAVAAVAGAALRRRRSEMNWGAGRLMRACWGLMWRSLAHRGLTKQAGNDARRHAAFKP